MINRLLLSVAGLAAIVGYCLYRGQSAKVAKTEVREDLGRWEGEGGNDPAVPTPSPAPTPQSSYSGSEAQH